ncbi:MAG TPA: hypothetical protein VL403_02700 [Candidatus Kryptonia bacterium]|nr:hypothetical protein [Candidatus Kryptonia bacterium]
MNLDVLPEWLSLDALQDWWSVASRFVRFWGPVMALPGLAAPVSFLGSLLSLLILSGVAIAGLATFIVAALMLYLMLTEVFGLSIDVAVA